MTITVGDRLPRTTLVRATPDGPDQVDSETFFAGRKVALFAVPGAFTPTCSARHLPGYLERGADLKAKGIDEIACTAVNDAFVMSAWSKANDAAAITMLADGNGEFAQAVGLTADSSRFGMGTRSQRYAMIVDDGVVTALHVEGPGEFKVSSADHLLSTMA
jgi:peroxiredoxin